MRKIDKSWKIYIFICVLLIFMITYYIFRSYQDLFNSLDIRLIIQLFLTITNRFVFPHTLYNLMPKN